ncbi:MAG: hypothetical protein H6508_02195 [Calditrichaeota bacterium]|nr:hypothetical protein [Calditrichota bacterium]
MSTRTFTGRTFAEALNKIKAELGAGAVILKSEKRQTSSSFGLGGRDFYEVTASDGKDLQALPESGTEFANELDVKTQEQTSERRPASQTYEMALLRSEVAALRDQLSEIVKFFKYSNLPAMPEPLSRSFANMTEAGIERELATDLAAEALVQLGPAQLESPEQISKFVIGKVSKIAPPAVNRPMLRTGKPYKIALVGAPGAGKTSTLQKLATDPKAYGKLKLGLISLDTHRLAAIEQLRTFARVSGLPLEIIYQPKDVAAALTKLAGCQMILIDTAGCAPGEDQRLSDLSEMLGALEPDETHLMLNSTTRTAEQFAMARRFQTLGVTHLSFSRLDESAQPGSLVTISRLTSKPIAWLAAGQDFLNRIERFRPEWLETRMFSTSASPVDITTRSEQFVPLRKAVAGA